MKKIIVGLVVALSLGFMFSIVDAADLASAGALFSAGKYAEAEVEYKAVLPSLKDINAGIIQYQIGYCEYLQKNYDKAVAEFEKVVLIEGAQNIHIAYAYMFKAFSLREKNIKSSDPKRFDGAIAELQKIALIENTGIGAGIVTPSQISYAQLCVADLYKALGEKEKSQAEYMKVCNKGGSIANFKEAIKIIDPNVVGIDNYIAYLKKVLVATSPTTENAEFLGYVKSEIEKLK